MTNVMTGDIRLHAKYMVNLLHAGKTFEVNEIACTFGHFEMAKCTSVTGFGHFEMAKCTSVTGFGYFEMAKCTIVLLDLAILKLCFEV